MKLNRVDGPYCENGSCQVLGPLPTANALQWEGEMVKKQVLGKEVYSYNRPFEQTIGFVKITKEYDKKGALAGSRHFVKGMEVSGFDYQQFFQRVSENLPDWVYFRIAKKGIPPYTLNRGVEVEG
jgi:hypothetical protein